MLVTVGASTATPHSPYTTLGMVARISMRKRDGPRRAAGRISLMNVATEMPTGAASVGARTELTGVPTRNGKGPSRSPRLGLGSQVLEVTKEKPNALIDGHEP